MVISTEAKKARFEMPDKYKTKSTYEQQITIKIFDNISCMWLFWMNI